MKQITQGPIKGRESLSKLGGEDNSTPQINYIQKATDKNKLIVLESIAKKWSSRSLYPSPLRAMIALLGGDHD
jgi:hypothetical protein